jgi:hypothetical protein
VLAILTHIPGWKLLLGETVNVLVPVPIVTLVVLVSFVALRVIAVATALVSVTNVGSAARKASAVGVNVLCGILRLGGVGSAVIVILIPY